MKDLTLTQEFSLCQMNKKGKLDRKLSVMPDFALGTAALYELYLNDNISLTKEIKKEPNKELKYLVLTYDFIKKQKKLELESVVQKICFNDKLIKLIFDNCKEQLLADDCLEEVELKGFLNTSKIATVSKAGSTDFVIQKIRTEVLEYGEISENTIPLIALLAKTKKLEDYFSKYELDALKARIQVLKTDEQYRFMFNTIKEMESLKNGILLDFISIALHDLVNEG